MNVVAPTTELNDLSEQRRESDLAGWERDLFLRGPTVVLRWGPAHMGHPVHYASPNLRRWFGYRPEELTRGRLMFDAFLHPADVPRIYREAEPYRVAGAHSIVQEYRVARRDGEYRWVYDYTEVTRDDDGEILYGDGYLIDITDRKRRESESDRLICELRGAVAESRGLSGMHKVCSSCRRVAEGDDSWRQIEAWVERYSEARFTHVLCPQCVAEHYPEVVAAQLSDT